MAHTDACKIQVLRFVEKLRKEERLGLNEACKRTEAESDGIPWETIKRWFREAKGKTDKHESGSILTHPPTTPPQEEPTNGDVGFDNGPARGRNKGKLQIRFFFSQDDKPIYDLIVKFFKSKSRQAREGNEAFLDTCKFYDLIKDDLVEFFVEQIEKGEVPVTKDEEPAPLAEPPQEQ
jgi:hypothetical protein